MRPHRRTLALIALGWALFGWMHGTQLYLGIRAEVATLRVSYGRFVLWQVLCWMGWAVLTPIVIYLCRRFPLALRPKPIAIHLAAAVTLPLIRTLGLLGATLFARPFPTSPANLPQAYLGMLSTYFNIDVLVYCLIAGITHAVAWRDRLRERDLQLTRAQLANLRLQLQPHFLFNTLHSIASLVRDNQSKAAVSMIAGLSDLLRYSLENAGRNVVPLSEELEVVQRYLEIEQTRFSDRLTFALDVPADTYDAAVPTLLLQPLVENAIRHGIARSTAGGRLEVRARREGEQLVLEVFNDGPPLSPNWRRGVGLASTEGRVEQLELENAPSGVIARVRIPFSRELGDG